jgi:hypothetical protein
MRKTMTAAAAFALAGLLATVVLAGTVNGTPKNDVLRGTAKADAINGKAGNDKLYGLGGNDKLVGAAGNDLLVGGPGKDDLNCGPGKDSAQADDSDKVSTSCEAVSGVTPPAISIADASVAEGNAGQTALSFSVTLSKAGVKPVSVHYAIANGTASAPADFAGADGTLTFTPGEKSKPLSVSVVGETAYEPDETLTVALSSPVNATIVRGTATGTIQNDDPPAQPGHYAGTTAQNEPWAFDVTADGRGVTNLTSGDINESCSPGGSLYGGRLNLRNTYPIAADQTFTIDLAASGTINGIYPYTGRLLINGKFSGNGATGTYVETTSFTIGSINFSCSSNQQSWTVTRTG